MKRLEDESSSAIKLFDAVSEIYAIFYQAKTDRWMLVTDGGSAFKTNAEGLIIASANPERLDTDCEKLKARTVVFAIGLDRKTIGEWIIWISSNRHYPERKPDMGFNYVS